MTITPEALDKEVEPKLEKILKDRRSSIILEEIFLLGYATSEPIVIFENKEKGLLVEVVFRTLTPPENRDIYETLVSFMHPEAQFITQKLETLARAIVRMNDMPLTLSAADQEDYAAKIGRSPTPLDQARYLLSKQNKSTVLVDALYEAYTNFVAETETSLHDLKKK